MATTKPAATATTSRARRRLSMLLASLTFLAVLSLGGPSFQSGAAANGPAVAPALSPYQAINRCYPSPCH
jgi:hypothetical protein